MNLERIMEINFMNGIFGKKLKNLNMDPILDGKAELL